MEHIDIRGVDHERIIRNKKISVMMETIQWTYCDTKQNYWRKDTRIKTIDIEVKMCYNIVETKFNGTRSGEFFLFGISPSG